MRYPLWQKSLRDAILEFDTQRLSVKVHRAEQAISERLHELTPETLDFHEQQALKDALATLEILKRHEQR